MEFEWDEIKRQTNLAKHGLDFIDARMIWNKPVIDPCDSRNSGTEIRYAALGIVGRDEIIVVVVYTKRAARIRLISARRARRNERKAYQDRFGRGL
ncbi:BrnT family toxin [Sphingosinicella soli]|uniref:BrnT family toxin n=1 Tax=Sphingosinicella soli TaxID=333708 RepID=UPI00160F85A6|nr:BrnT family toxin [Sphingosinicella soli]